MYTKTNITGDQKEVYVYDKKGHIIMKRWVSKNNSRKKKQPTKVFQPRGWIHTDVT